MSLNARKEATFLLSALIERKNLPSLIALACVIIFSVVGTFSGSHDASRALYAFSAACLAAALLAYERLKLRARPSGDRSMPGLLPTAGLAISQRWRRCVFATVGLAITFCVAYAGNAVLTGNFGTVVAGQAYRSGQLSDHLLRYYVGRYGIKTVLNLRGENPGQHWYDKERANTDALGVRHIDFRMSAKRMLPQDRAEELIAIMEAAPKPILIHCASGADRTGLAAALYLASIAKSGEAKAEAQMSLRYGHVPLPFLPSYAMTRSWERLEPFLGYDRDET